MPSAFKSKAQQRLFFANPKLRKWAKGKARATKRQAGGFKALPERKHALKGRKLRSTI